MRRNSLFARKTSPILGLDIGSSCVKLLELSFVNHRLRLECYSIEPIPRNSSVNADIPNKQIVGQTLQQAVLRSGTLLNHAAVAISDSKVVSKIITMPAFLAEDEIESQIHLEADQFIAIPPEDISLDFEIQGVNSEEPDNVDVRIVVCRTADVHTFVSVLELADLNCELVDFESNALESATSLITNQLVDAGIRKLVAVIDIGASTTKLSVLHDMKMVYSREHTFGGRELSEKIQAYYGLDYKEAEFAKRQGGLPSTYKSEVLEPYKQQALSKIKQALQTFFSTCSFDSLDQLILTGGGTSIDGIDTFIKDNLDIETCIANPFLNIDISPQVDDELLLSDASSLLLASGLALRGFNVNG